MRLLPLLIVVLFLGSCGGGGSGGGIGAVGSAGSAGGSGGGSRSPTSVAGTPLVIPTCSGRPPSHHTIEVVDDRIMPATASAVASDAGWLEAVLAVSGTQVTATADPSGLAVGRHDANLTITLVGGDRLVVPVHLLVGDVLVTIDRDSDRGTVPRALFGANMQWEGLAHQALSAGELIGDRSFRDQRTATKVWAESAAGGAITWLAAGGDPAPGGHAPYPGCLRLSRSDAGGSVVFQSLARDAVAGEKLALVLSSYGEAGASIAVTAYLARPDFSALLTPVAYLAPVAGTWTRHALTLTPDASGPAVLVVGAQALAAGSVLLDEVRLASGTRAAVNPLIRRRIQELGVTGLRWPGGTLVDTFDWRESVGDLAQRGECPDLAGRHQTPSFGLDEVLGLCEDLGLDPLIQVNVLGGAVAAAELVQYCYGDVASVQGARRAANGHAAAYAIPRWELGNEPSPAYNTSAIPAQAGADYARLAANVLAGMRAESPGLAAAAADNLDFRRAPWLAASPLLASWDAGIAGLAVNSWSGHYYALHGNDADVVRRWRLLMAAGTVLRGNLAAAPAGRPVWVTEYQVAVEDGSLVASHLRDAQSGLVVADILLALMDLRQEVAHIHNLCEPSGFGLLVDPRTWTLRPAGLVFKLCSPFAGRVLLDSALAGAGTVSLGAGTGNQPDGVSYAMVGALAARNGGGEPHLLLINRTHDQDMVVAVDAGLDGAAAALYRFAPADLAANNEETTPQVAITTGSARGVDALLLALPRHSLLSADFSAVVLRRPKPPLPTPVRGIAMGGPGQWGPTGAWPDGPVVRNSK